MIKYYPMKLLSIENNKIHQSIYLSSNGIALKNCSESPNFIEPLDIRLEAFCDVGPVVSFTYPYFLLSDENDWIYGYGMEYLKDYETIESFVKDPRFSLSFEQKKQLLLQIHHDLKKINKSFVVGDINLSNILIDKNGDGKVIDWENGYPINSTLTSLDLYRIRFLSPLQQDAIKMFISSISLLYKTNFESLFSRMDVGEMLDFARRNNLDSSIIYYLEDFDSLICSNSKMPIYFDDYLKSFKRLSDVNIKRVRRKVNDILFLNF